MSPPCIATATASPERSTGPSRPRGTDLHRADVGEHGLGAITVAVVVYPDALTDRAAAYPRVLDEFLPAAQHVTVPYANNRVEADHGPLKAGLLPICGLKRDHSLRVVAPRVRAEPAARPQRVCDRGEVVDMAVDGVQGPSSPPRHGYHLPRPRHRSPP